MEYTLVNWRTNLLKENDRLLRARRALTRTRSERLSKINFIYCCHGRTLKYGCTKLLILPLIFQKAISVSVITSFDLRSLIMAEAKTKSLNLSDKGAFRLTTKFVDYVSGIIK